MAKVQRSEKSLKKLKLVHTEVGEKKTKAGTSFT